MHQDNSILVEKDTGRRYWFDTEGATESTGTYAHAFPVGSYDNDKQGFYVANTSSAVYGKTINSVSFWLKRGTSTSGTAYVRVWSNSGSGNTGTQAHEFGSIALSDLTTSYVKHTFSTGSHTLAVNDTVGVQYSGGSSTTSPVVEGAAYDVYDGVNTIRNRFTTGGTFSPYTGHDIKFEVTSPTWNINPKYTGSSVSQVTSGGYNYIKLLDNGTLNTYGLDVEVLVVGAGGGGGQYSTGGAGGGAVLLSDSFTPTSGSLTVTVGAGGIKQSASPASPATVGGNSSYDGNIAGGGGAGATHAGGSTTGGTGGNSGGAGGSGQHVAGGGGGSGGASLKSGVTGYTSTNHTGGGGTAQHFGGGGGGAGAGGSNSTASAGGNGVGGSSNTALNSFLSNSSTGVEETSGNWWVGGAAGGGRLNSGAAHAGTGTSGKGGAGNGSAGVANTGGGGSNHMWDGGSFNGGSGIVVVRHTV